jgi:hypothetical protein
VVEVSVDRGLVEERTRQRVGLGREVQRRVHLARGVSVQHHELPLEEQATDAIERLLRATAIRYVLEEPQHAPHLVGVSGIELIEERPQQLRCSLEPWMLDAPRVERAGDQASRDE